jgi:hypothetical protein
MYLDVLPPFRARRGLVPPVSAENRGAPTHRVALGRGQRRAG